MSQRINFNTQPPDYRHWRLEFEPPLARLILDVDEGGGLQDSYELKQNSYDLSVDIELADAVQRLRFEHPEVKVVMLCSGKDNIFCAGANIRMLAAASHMHKVNFCKFTNETRNAIEDASRHSGQIYFTALQGSAAGGGYELALATEKIILLDDGNAAVSLPEVPLLGVLPGTGGLTRIVDKRRVRRDVADVFCTQEEGMRGAAARDARLVDEVAPRSTFSERCRTLAAALAAASDRPDAGGPVLGPLDKQTDRNSLQYSSLQVTLEPSRHQARINILGPAEPPPGNPDAALSDSFWPLRLMRELDDALLELRFNEPTLGSLFFTSRGDPERVLAFDRFLQAHRQHWFVREVNLYITRVLKRLDLTSRSLFTLIEPGSCFAGFLAEVALAADRAYMLEGLFADAEPAAEAHLTLSGANFAAHPMVNGLSRLQVRFLERPQALAAAQQLRGQPLDAAAAAAAELITAALDDIDWEDEIRLLEEARAGFSADALTAMEANLRFAGPETMESKIFARLSAWQNWVFQRPNAVGPQGALPLYGSGRRPAFDKNRV